MGRAERRAAEREARKYGGMAERVIANSARPMNQQRQAWVEAGDEANVLAHGGSYLLKGTPFKDPIVVKWASGEVTVHQEPLNEAHAQKVQAAFDADRDEADANT